MEMFGLDITTILVTAAYIAFFGGVLIGFVIFYDKNPYVPRRYYKVKIKNKEGKPVKECKAWIVTVNHVKWLRVGFTGFPGFKGVEKDIAIMETINEKGILELIEDIPGKYEPENYTPANVPITQKEAFIAEVIANISEDSRPAFELKLRETIANNSRIMDLNTSQATKQYIAQARREAERVRGDDFISKYGPIISLIVACLFAYLIIDGSVKAYQATMGAQNAVMENGYNQVIQQCGGVYHSLNPPQNATATPAKTGVQIPFVTT